MQNRSIATQAMPVDDSLNAFIATAIAGFDATALSGSFFGQLICDPRLQFVFAKASVECRGRDSEKFGRLAAVPTGSLKCIDDLLPLRFAQVDRCRVAETAVAILLGRGVVDRNC